MSERPRKSFRGSNLPAALRRENAAREDYYRGLRQQEDLEAQQINGAESTEPQYSERQVCEDYGKAS